MKKSILYALLVASTSMYFTSCKKDDTTEPDDHDHGGEVITAMKLIISDGFNPADTVTFSDPDGVGGNAPTIDSVILDNSNTYLMEILLLDETKTPVDTISNEVEAEGTTHLFVFTPNPASGLMTATPNDLDVNGDPIGLSAQITTGSAGSGSLNVKLRHYNSANDKANGTNNYESDIDVTFGVRIQ